MNRSTVLASVVRTAQQRDLDLDDIVTTLLQSREPIVPEPFCPRVQCPNPLNEDQHFSYHDDQLERVGGS